MLNFGNIAGARKFMAKGLYDWKKKEELPYMAWHLCHVICQVDVIFQRFLKFFYSISS